jgi:uncharacterized protein YgfB (UPF0149 family)
MVASTINLPGYQSVAEILQAANSDLSAAECHGLIAAMMQGGSEITIARVFSREAEILENDADLASVFRQLVNATSAGYRSDDFDFQLLLPADEEPLPLRVRALAEWCAGYVMGLLESGISDFERLPGDAAEVARDMVEISQLDDDAAADGSEGDLMQLQEYIRVGVQIIHAALTQKEPGKSAALEEDTFLQ